MDAALACGHIEQGRHGLQCAPSHAFAAFREVALGERDLREWRSAVLALFDGQPELSAVRGPSFERLVAIMRFAMRSGLHEQNRRELLARNRPFDPAAVCFIAFGDPFNVPVADLIPAVHREAVAEGVLLHLLRRPNGSAPAAVAWALDFVSQAHAAPEAPSTLKYGLCEHLLWQGRSQEIGTLLGTDASARAVALHGAAAVLDADPRRATELYARAERLRVDETRARAGGGRLRGAKLIIPRLPASLAFLRIAALVVVNEPQTVGAAHVLCVKETRAAENPSVWNFIREAIRARSHNSHTSRHLPLMDSDAMANLCTLVAGSWARIPLDEAQQQTAASDLKRFRTAGYQRAALEIDAALAMARGWRKDSAAPGVGDPDGGGREGGELNAARWRHFSWTKLRGSAQLKRSNRSWESRGTGLAKRPTRGSSGSSRRRLRAPFAWNRANRSSERAGGAPADRWARQAMPRAFSPPTMSGSSKRCSTAGVNMIRSALTFRWRWPHSSATHSSSMPGI